MLLYIKKLILLKTHHFLAFNIKMHFSSLHNNMMRVLDALDTISKSVYYLFIYESCVCAAKLKARAEKAKHQSCSSSSIYIRLA